MRNNTERAKIAAILVGAVMFIEIAMIISSYLQINLLQRVVDGIEVSDAEVNWNDTREGIVGILYLVVFIISTVCFIMWFRRAYYNLHLKAKHLLYTEGWAAGAWFVPILNLFRPYQIMKELYERTDHILSEHFGDYQEKKGTTIVGVWWFMWIVANVISNISTRMTLRAETAEEFLSSTQLDLFSSIISVPMAIVAIIVILDYSKMEKRLYQLDKEEGLPSTNDLDFRGNEDILDAMR